MPVRKSLNHIPSSPAKEHSPGIVTILRSDNETTKPGSIRRTLSADMSSKKWHEQNGLLSPMKKIVSSEAMVHPSADSSSESGEEEYEQIPNQDDVWMSIQAQKEKEKPVWSSILSQKSENNSILSPPYVYPLVKRSGSTLSDKSLKVCTESLGSETGSDCLISCSEILSDEEEDRQRVVGEYNSDPFADLHVVKYKNSPPRPFPPPLPSISGDGASLHMHSRRENGRLVVEAVSLPPRNYFQAQRQDGRLLLTLIHAPPTSNEVEEEMFDNMDEEIQEEELPEENGGDEEEEETIKDENFMIDQSSSLPSGMIGVLKSGQVMKRLVEVGNINPKWSKKVSRDGDLMRMKVENEEELPIPQSLPPPLRFIPATASFNKYEYFWRNSTTVSGGFINTNKMNGRKGYDNQDLVLMRANKTEKFVPYLRGCKEGRRSVSIPEPSYWIVTSS